MRKHLDIKSYLDAVCDQIRWKSARAVVSQELEHHISDQRDVYVADGMDEETAVQKAVAEMGDPIVTGQQLDRVHRPRPDWVMLGMVAVLVVLGGVLQFILSQSGAEAENQFARFLIYMPMGVAALVIAYFADYSLLGKYPKTLFFVYWAVCAGAVLFLVVPGNGSIRGDTYFTLPFLPLLAGIVYSQRGKGYRGLLVCLLFYGLAMAVCLAMPSTGGVLILTVAYFVMMAAALFRNWFRCNKLAGIALACLPPVLLALVSLLSNASLRSRLRYVFAPQLEPMGRGYFGMALRNVLSGVKLWGPAEQSGVWAEYTLENILPGWNTYTLFTYLMGRFGVVVGIFVVLTIFALIVRLFLAVFRQKSALGSVVSLSVALAIVIQSVFCLIENFGLSVFGAALPLLSYSAVGFVVNMALLGLALSAVRRNSIVTDTISQTTKRRGKMFRLFHGRVVIDLRDRHTA